MDEKINVRHALEVFNKILSKGESIAEGKQLNGITASSDFDGYTLFLSNAHATLTIFFHNKFSLDCETKKEKDNFLKALDNIHQHY